MSKDHTFHRKLAAILVADVVGYSRMMETDEVGTLRQVQSIQRTCITPITAAYGGRLIKTTGDGFLFEFSSAVDAILFAVDFQKKVQATMASVAEATRIVFRVGVHAGDVLSDGVDMFGDGVNVAARLETLCAPGGICMSAVVQQQLYGKIELPLVDLGEYQVKNITRAVHVFGIEADAIGRATPAGLGGVQAILRKKRPWVWLVVTALVLITAVLSAAAIHRRDLPVRADGPPPVTQTLSLAVLPFTSLTNDAKPDDFADALVDNLTTALSVGIPSTTVIASASSLTYKGKMIDPRQVGRELGAKYLLEGSVQKFTDHLRVNVQLIEAATAGLLWSDQFDEPLSNIKDLQDQITAGIANALAVQVIRLEASSRKNTTNASAVDLIFRGESRMSHLFSLEDSKLAEADYRRALTLDPNNPDAMVNLGHLLVANVANSGPALSETQKSAMLAEAGRLFEQVRSQNGRQPSLHNGLGLIYLIRGRTSEAAEQFRKEIEIDRNASGAYANLAECVALLGQPADAVALLETSLRLNPRDPHISYKYMDLMEVYFLMKKYPEAIIEGDRAYGEDPNDARLLYTLAAINALAGRLDEAKAKLAEASVAQPGFTIGAFRRSPGATRPDQIDLTNRYCDGLRRAGLPE